MNMALFHNSDGEGLTLDLCGAVQPHHDHVWSAANNFPSSQFEDSKMDLKRLIDLPLSLGTYSGRHSSLIHLKGILVPENHGLTILLLALGSLSLARFLYQTLSVLLQIFVIPGKNVRPS